MQLIALLCHEVQHAFTGVPHVIMGLASTAVDEPCHPDMAQCFCAAAFFSGGMREGTDTFFWCSGIAVMEITVVLDACRGSRDVRGALMSSFSMVHDNIRFLFGVPC